jgi:hypothetical protein
VNSFIRPKYGRLTDEEYAERHGYTYGGKERIGKLALGEIVRERQPIHIKEAYIVYSLWISGPGGDNYDAYDFDSVMNSMLGDGSIRMDLNGMLILPPKEI